MFNSECTGNHVAHWRSSLHSQEGIFYHREGTQKEENGMMRGEGGKRKLGKWEGERGREKTRFHIGIYPGQFSLPFLRGR